MDSTKIKIIGKEYFSSDKSYMDTILNKNHYFNSVHFKVLLSTAIALMFQGIHILMFGPFLKTMQAHFAVEKKETEMLTCLFFVGYALGALFSGFLAMILGRMWAVRLSFTTICVTQFLTVYLPSFNTFLICRGIIGVCLGLSVNLNINIYTEYCPTKFRGFYVNFIWLHKIIAGICFTFLCLWLAPEFEKSGFEPISLSVAGFQVGLLLFYLLLAEDSPRHLSVRGKYAKAINILESIIGDCHFSEEVKNELISQFSSKNTDSDSFFRIFSSKYLKTTALSMLLWTISSISFYGPYLILTLTLDKLQEEHKNESAKQIYMDNFFALAGAALAVITGSLLCEIKALGRRYTIACTYILAVAAMSVAVIKTEFFSKLYPLYSFGIYAGYITLSVYTSEIYPTSIRDKAIGFLLFLMRVGGASSQYYFYELFERSLLLPYYTIIGGLALAIVACFFLDKESYNTALDSDQSERERLVNNKA